jgi:hypothetical protein
MQLAFADRQGGGKTDDYVLSLNSNALITNPTACASLKVRNRLMLIRAQRMRLRVSTGPLFSKRNLTTIFYFLF